MRWSKLKQRIEDRLAPALAGRVHVHATSYREADDSQGRGWITIDGREVATFCDFQALRRDWELARALQVSQGTTDYTDPAQAPGYYAAHDTATQSRHRDGIFTRYEFYQALWDSLSLSIDAALRSENVLIRALAMLDGRLGKRRLRALRLADDEHPLVRRCFDLRREAEGLTLPVDAGEDGGQRTPGAAPAG